MARDRQILLHFIELGCLNGDKRIFLTVDGFGFQRREHFTKGHWHSVGAQGLESVNKDVVLHDTHFDAVKVFHLGDRALAVGQVAKTVFPISQIHQAGFFELLVEVHAGRTVQHGIGFSFIGKQERQVKRAQFLHDAHQR